MKSASMKPDVLVPSAIAGDRQALESLLAHFHDPLMQFIRGRRLRHGISTLADEDVLQEALLEAFRSVRSLEAQGSAAFFAWLKVIARTRMINMVKAQRAQKRGGLVKQVHGAMTSATATSLINKLAADQPTPSRIIRRKELVEHMEKALAALKENRRQVLELRFGRGLSVDDVAAQLGLTEGAVKMHINRSLKELRKGLAVDSSITWQLPRDPW